ncbi:MAG: hypothetical protein VW338_11685 [Rhodospirillaceae bacterium]
MTPARARSRATAAGGGDLIYEIGSGYFGCRNDDGTFSPERFLDPECRTIADNGVLVDGDELTFGEIQDLAA